jgi:hypothetical protein
MAATTEPSLLRFIYDRLEADAGDSDERIAMRAQRDREIVLACAAAMEGEQGFPPIVPEAAPFSELGSQVLKLIAATSMDHPDYRQSWAPAYP